MVIVEESVLETLAKKIDIIAAEGKSMTATDDAIRLYLDGNVRFWDKEYRHTRSAHSYSKKSVKQLSPREKEGLEYLKALRIQSISGICDELIKDPGLSLDFPFHDGANATIGDSVQGLVQFTSSLFRGYLDYKFKAGWPEVSFMLNLRYPKVAKADGRFYSLVLFDGTEEEGKYHVGFLYQKLCRLNRGFNGKSS